LYVDLGDPPLGNKEELKKLLKNSHLFGAFSLPVLEAIVPMLQSCIFPADKLICHKGDDSDCLYIIQHGEVEISVSSSEGKIILLGMLSAGDVFGEIGLLDKGSRTANVIAKTDVLLYRLDKAHFDELTDMFGPEELKALTSYVCFLFRRATNNLEEKSFLDADVRIARKIGELCKATGDKKGRSFKVTISQESLGRMAGLSREATNRALSRLQGQGYIECHYKSIVVLNMELFLQSIREF
jgi:CRP/FNR family cyclic AMP-dependent transcriptional regulator